MLIALSWQRLADFVKTIITALVYNNTYANITKQSKKNKSKK